MLCQRSMATSESEIRSVSQISDKNRTQPLNNLIAVNGGLIAVNDRTFLCYGSPMQPWICAKETLGKDVRNRSWIGKVEMVEKAVGKEVE